MASFKTQIENYAGPINSEDYQTALENGVKDVVNRMMKIAPESMFMFSSVVQNSSGVSGITITDTDKIIDVTRDITSNGIPRNCIEVPASMRGEVSDPTSLHAATKEYPVYYKLETKLIVVPEITTAGSIHVNKVVYGAITNPSATTGAIANFPTGMIPLVVLYASGKVLQEKMAEYNSLPTKLDIASLLSGLSNLPNVPQFALSDSEFDGGGEFQSTIFDMPQTTDIPSIADVAGLPDIQTALAGGTIATSGSSTDMIEPQKWFDILGEFIEVEEDTELSRAQVEKISAYANWYQTALSENLQKFNAQWEAFSTRLQNGIQIMSKNADLAVQDYAQTLQRYQTESQRLVNNVNSQVSAFNSNLQRAVTDYKWLTDRYVFVMQEYEKSFLPYANKGEPAS